MKWLNEPVPYEDVGDCVALSCGSNSVCSNLCPEFRIGCLFRDHCNVECGLQFN